MWFQAIYLMTQDKKGVSAMKLHRHLGISYNAAWRMKHKLMQVMMERDREHPLSGWIQLDDAYLGGERSGGKRGRGAPGKTPFVAAIETNEQGHPLRMKLTVVEGFRLTEIAAWAQQHLGAGTRVVSDGLACFHGVTAAGCIHEPVVVGSGRAAVERPEFRWVNTILGNIKNALRGTYHAIRPKVCSAISLGVRVPVQSPLRPARHHPEIGLRGAQNAANAGKATQVTLSLSGNQEVYCAVGRQGQGSETTQAQVAAEELGIPFEKVEIETGDTDSCPWSHGSLASNTMYRVGWATRAASKDAKRQLLEIAGREFFDASPEELDVVDGVIFSKDPHKTNIRITIEEALNHFRSADALGQASSITGRPGGPMPPASTFARHFAAHFADVEVDTETGEIKLLDFLATQDSGTIMNPQVMKNQMIGGAICGAGFAIYEALVFEEGSGRIKNANLLDYKLLRAADFPLRGEVIYGDSYDPVGPFGARSAGEAPAAAAGPAIAQAVYNAIGMWVDMPMTPENVVAALDRA